MPGPLLKIRRFKAEDLGELYEIDRICFPEDIAFSRTELLFHLTHLQSITCVAQGADRILGFVLARVEDRQYAHVLTLDVVPQVRQGKIGTRLMNELHRELEDRNIHAAVLEVGVTNLKAQRLYEKLGYRRIGTLAGYYRGKEDAYQMIRLFDV